MPKKPVEMTKTSLRLPTELLRRAKHYGVDHDIDLQDLVAQALDTFLKGAK